MAPKRPTPPPPPPPPVASSEETASGSDSDESEEEEESPLVQPAPVVSNKGAESDSSGEEESEEEEEEEDLVRSSATKSRDPPQENREEDDSSDEEEDESSESEKAEAPPPPPLNPAPKQGAEGNGPKVSSPKRQAFHRIWSTEDEVRILEALAAHRREHGSLPQTDALIATLAGSLDNTGYGRKELQGKVSTLKRRYESTAKKKGDLPSKGHDRRLYDLSKSVWGSEAAAAAANGTTTAPREFGEMCELYPHLAEEVKLLEAAHPGLFKRDFGKLDDDKAHALDMKIKKQRIAEISVVLRRGDLTKEVTKVLTELVE
uniref:Glabrous enhancer-binding protein-like DBD domain-containing protein n=1 Tax=Oryza glumipatula TaxID=40148 RepID=A0A0D9YZ04_9ORYZ